MNASVIAITSKFSVETRHFDSLIVILRLRTLKLITFRLSLSLVMEVMLLVILQVGVRRTA